MSIYDTLNKEQKEAVFCTEGPLLLLAGAGSGKTRVLVHRIAYLIEEMGVNPWNIMAITFTNKAAKEMRERVDNMIGYGAESIWVSTFHSTCVRILRRHIDLLGYETNFTIYDTEDQKKVMKEICKRMKIDTKQLSEKAILNTISHAKEQYLTPDEYRREHEDNYRESRIADVYEAYQKQLKSSNALDFDDLLMKTVQLFEHFPNVLELWQERFRYIMIDEYQDTNGVQFLLVKMLSARYRNLCVVGDDDQSIYKFRGADIRNILDFEKVYPDARVIKLEQNYRSTKNILDAANGVIHHNFGRKDKTLWTGNEEGDKVSFKQYADNYQEALAVASQIERLVEEGASYKDFAILNRTNAQSRSFEEKLLLKNIPYKIIGGINFYSRMEVKDILSYLKVICNAVDDQAVKRIINVPKRGIGQTTIDRVQEYALLRGISFMDALYMVRDISTVKAAAAKKIEEFTQLIDQFKKNAEEMPLDELFDEILAETGYLIELQAEDTQEAKDRIANIDELKSKVVTYLEEEENATLTGLLEQIALVADIDSVVGDEAVLIMTLHSAKGLEFPYVFIGGMEEGIFPGYRCENAEDEDELEEERRLCYVGITRARRKLYLSAARCRMMRGQSQYNRISRFISEIPDEVMQDDGAMASQQNQFAGFGIGSQNTNAIFEQNPKKFVMKSSYQLHSTGNAGQENKTSRISQRNESGKKAFSTKAAALDYEVGDKVRHIKFGTGIVTELISAGADYEVAVDFEKCGIKRMFASFAKLKKQD